MGISDYITRHLGRPDRSTRDRMGRGVVGNTTFGWWATGATIVGVSFALRSEPYVALAAIAALILAYLLYLFGTYYFAHKHPDTAMLGDAEWLKWSKEQLAAKDQSLIIDERPIIGSSKDGNV